MELPEELINVAYILDNNPELNDMGIHRIRTWVRVNYPSSDSFGLTDKIVGLKVKREKLFNALKGEKEDEYYTGENYREFF